MQGEAVVATSATERRLAAIMVADVAGSSRLMERDETSTFARLRQVREEVTHRKVGEHGGRLVKTTGDGFLAEFASATAAVRCALDIQRDMIAREAGRSPDTRIRLRIGINVGDIIVDGDDVAGDGVNIAARLEPLAPPDGVCISASVQEQLHDDLGVTLVDLGEQKLKNIARPIRAFAIMLAGGTRPANAAEAAPAVQAFAEFPSIAVLPFVNLSRDEENEYFADGLAEELLNMLTKIRGLRVVSRTSAFFFKGKDIDIPTVARRLNVAMILEGSVRKSGKRVRIATQLIEAATDSHLWSETYDRTLEDIFAVQDDIAQSVVKELRTALLGERPDGAARALVNADVIAAAKGRSKNAEAHELYLRAQFLLERHTPDDTAKSIEYFRSALEFDPHYALAWAGLAGAYSNQAGFGWAPLAETFERARVAAQRALDLEPDLAEGHSELGWIRMTYDWDWREADASYTRALELAPGNRPIVSAASLLADNLGRKDAAVALARRGVELDPLNAVAQGNLGLRCLNAGLLEEAAAALGRALELNPQCGLVHWALGTVYLEQGRPEEALGAFEREEMESLRLSGLTSAQHALGRRLESEAALRELVAKGAEDSAFQIAQAFAYRGEADTAFAWLERAFAQRDSGLSNMQQDPLLRNLHADPRWQAFLKKMRLAA